MQKLGRNTGGYRGETIVIGEVLDALLRAALAQGWHHERLPVDGAGDLLVLRRHGPGSSSASTRGQRLYLSAGIHGDEPAGPLAALELVRQDRWPPGSELWLCPCLNPSGFPLSRRESAAGADLNRDYRAPRTPEVRAHVAWLERQPRFDLAICLHEDWESHGFYLYELNPDGLPTRAEAAIAAVEQVCVVDRSEIIEGRPARGGIIRPDLNPLARPDWPEAFYLIQHQTRHSYTLEAPSDFQLAARVAALVTAVNCLVQPDGTPGEG